MRFLYRKGVIEVILYLHKARKAGYYEMQKKNFVGGRQTFAKILQTLRREEIIARTLIDSHPPRVEYNLTTKGKEVAKILNQLGNVLRRK